MSLNDYIIQRKRRKKFIAEILIPYRGNRHPQAVSTQEFVRDPERGANCQTTTGGLLDRLGYTIIDPRSLELAVDTTYTIAVPRLELVRSHDVVIFHPDDGRTDLRLGHTTVAHIEGRSIYLIHNSIEHGRTVQEKIIWENQGRISAIKRPVRRNTEPDRPFLRAVGFEQLAA